MGVFDPYVQTDAATICWETGVRTKQRGGDKQGVYVSANDDGGYIKVKGVDFGRDGAGTFTASVANAEQTGTLELRLDTPDGALIGTLPVPSTGNWENWKTKTAAVSGAAGKHDLYFVFKGGAKGHIFNVDTWKFEEKKAAHDLVAVIAMIDKCKLDTASAGNTTKIKVQAVYADGAEKDVTAEAELTTSKSCVAKIDNGVVAAIAAGSTDITAAFGGKSDSVSLIVADGDK